MCANQEAGPKMKKTASSHPGLLLALFAFTLFMQLCEVKLSRH